MVQLLNDIKRGMLNLLWDATLTHLGGLQKGTKLFLAAKKKDFYVAQFGETKVATHIIGYDVRVEAVLLQKVAANLAAVLGGAVTIGLNTKSVVDIDPTPRGITGKRLELRPTAELTDANSYIIWNAVPIPNCEVVGDVDGEQAFKIVFEGQIDENDEGKFRLLQIRLGSEDVEDETSYFPQS